MSRKSKGMNAERDLIHKFWAADNWSAVRIAGSGSMKYPSSDLLATNKLRRLAIECKAVKSKSKYIPKEDITQLQEFSNHFGAEPWIAVRFNRLEWLFLNPEDLHDSGNCFMVSKELAEKKGLLFEEVIK
ncbi:MAG: Holliday junction resolvase Hjc [Candidatus Woesearchaeota archaeon]|jgi:Holliday junction resolvase|nr:Holliday junction resolvase Hjc [Candidatus Woesearchaeota archaeon]